MNATTPPTNTLPEPRDNGGGSSRFIDSTPLLDDGEALRARAATDGYLFFRGLLPADDVLRLRAKLFQVVEHHGWRQPGQALSDSTIDTAALNRVPDRDMSYGTGVSRAAYEDVQKIQRMHRLPHHPQLLALYHTLFGRAVLVHPRHIVRMVSPHRVMVPTPPHQDFPLIQGTSHTWTCWMPVGDCPRTMGGLTVLRGSHRLGYVPIVPAAGAGNIAAQLCPHETDWVDEDYLAGDVLTFPSFTVHKGRPCRLKDQMRLSLDVRYQPIDEPVEPASLRPHCDLDWEQIYAGWTRDDLKYYWRSLPLTFSTFDDTLLQPGAPRIC